LEETKYRGRVKIRIIKGDITDLEVDAIVNPANSLMLMGGGVSGAIKRRGGVEIEMEARKMAPVPVGKAVATHGGKLKVKYVIHAPTMERPAMRTTFKKVKEASKAAIQVALDLGVKSLAFPAMGAGVGGLSARISAQAILEAIEESLKDVHEPPLKEVILVAYTQEDYENFIQKFSEWVGR